MKEFSSGHKLMMYNGTFKLVENIEEGDVLMGADSQKCFVTSVDKYIKEMYLINPLINADSFIISKDHTLYLESTTVKKSEKNCYPRNVSVSLNDYLNWAKSKKHVYKLKRVKIDYDSNENLAVEPYYLGLWLGDGNSNNTSVTSMDNEIKKFMKDFAVKEDLDYVDYNPENKTASLLKLNRKNGSSKSNALTSKLKSIGVINNKHIPNVYKISSFDERCEIIAGIIDSDGYNNGHNYCEISFGFSTIAEDTCQVLNSLGIYTKVSKERGTCSNCKDYTGYRYRINFKMPDFIKPKIERKKYKPNNYKFRDRSRSAFSVEPLGASICYSITTENNVLFLDWQNIIN